MGALMAEPTGGGEHEPAGQPGGGPARSVNQPTTESDLDKDTAPVGEGAPEGATR
jgi:hypothetical protein